MNDQTTNSPADRDLIGRILGGDHDAFGTVIKNTEGLVAQIVFRMIPNAEDRKDIVQDIYLRIFHKLESFKFRSKLSTWIWQVAYHTCLNWLEKKKIVSSGNLLDGQYGSEMAETYIRTMDSPDGETDGSLIRKERSAILKEEIRKLPPQYQVLIVLYHQEELSYETIVQITGLPGGTVKSYLFRARKMLKENLLSKYKKEAL